MNRSAIDYVLLVPAVLILSAAAAFVILTVTPKPLTPLQQPAPNHRHLFESYRILIDFLHLRVRTEPISQQDLGPGFDDPFLDDLVKLETAADHLGNKQFTLLGNTLRSLESQHPYIIHRKDKLN
ncbi:MAG: hypothetical protein GY940_45340, partial [bacterium]|nr:hypothetical protein [bacterium]